MRSRALVAAIALAGAAVLAWAVTAIVTATHGFDTTDEGFYLLSYRWWQENPRNFSGVQYLYGPVFDLLGRDIAALRIFRLLTVLTAGAVFGWSFMRWLRLRRPAAPASRLWEVAGTVAITAAGGLIYGWIPATPAYNDITVLGGLLVTAAVLRTAAAVDRDERVPAWVPLLTGPLAVAITLAKWSSGVTIVTTGAAALIVVLWPRVRAILRFLGWAAAGAAAGLALIHLLVTPLDDTIRVMVQVTRVVAGKGHSPSDLLARYWDTTLTIFGQVLPRYGWLLAAVVALVVLRQRRAQRVAAVLAAGALGLALWHALDDGGLGGGAGANVQRYPATMIACVLVAVLAGLAVVVSERVRREPGSSLSRQGGRDWVVLGTVFAMPVVQAFGTDVPLLNMAVNSFAAWMAVIIAVLTGIEAAPAAARALLTTVAAGAVAAVVSISVGAMLLHPYRGQPHARTTATVAGVPALASVTVTPEQAAAYAGLRARLEPYLAPGGRAVMGFDKMAGVVYLLDGRSVGEAWYPSNDRARAAAGIRADCADGKPWSAERKPILLFNRAISVTELKALQYCGLDFATDYRLLGPATETMGLEVYVPVG